MIHPRVGWDIGGAHVKAALLQGPRVQTVVQVPCPLWQGLDELEAALRAAWETLGRPAVSAHAVTMTGELADGFADRRDGVARIAATVARQFPAGTVQLFGVDFAQGRACWHAPDEAPAAWRRIASVNWWATAQLVAQALPQALLADIGSTTTDFIAVRAGRVLAQGHDDHGRLLSGELVYHGVTRTPLCALGPQLRIDGRDCNVMNEFFATSADVYRLTGELDPAHDPHPAADHGAKDTRGTQQRLARMVGLDATDADAAAWLALAGQWRARQLDVLEAGLRRVAQATGTDAGAPLVTAGCGAFLAAELARRTGRRCVPFDSLLDSADATTAAWARVCAPCVAVACLRPEGS